MGLGGSITPNVEQSAIDAEPLDERDDVVAGIQSLDGVPTRLLFRKVCNIKLSCSRGSLH
jgi:hypothetical protein